MKDLSKSPRRSVGATTPLPPSFASNEAGMMTLDEYIGHLNPRGKWHPPEAYDFDTFDLNERFARRFLGETMPRGSYLDSARFGVFASTSGIFFTKNQQPVGVLIDGTLYHNDEGAKIPDEYWDPRNNQSIPLDIQQRQRVKYVEEYIPAVDNLIEFNTQKYPVVLRQFLSDGEPLVLRAEKSPIPNGGTSLAILDSEGRVLGVAQNEWGATLIAVAQEARGRGLGKVLSEVWYDLNPEFESGGMTSAGEALAIARWADRVREFRSRGWYSHLVRTGQMTRERVAKILADLPPKRTRSEQPDGDLQPTGVPLVMSDGFSYITVYDRALLDDPNTFLQNPDERFIYGHAFLRDSPSVGVFVFSIDYDRPFAELTTRAILQLARNNEEPLYDGEGYHDFLEGIEEIPGVTREGDYLIVNQDLLPLREMATVERQARQSVDPYRELEGMIMEMADTKWRY